jgi:hypothetical protein
MDGVTVFLAHVEIGSVDGRLLTAFCEFDDCVDGFIGYNEPNNISL